MINLKKLKKATSYYSRGVLSNTPIILCYEDGHDRQIHYDIRINESYYVSDGSQGGPAPIGPLDTEINKDEFEFHFGNIYRRKEVKCV